MAIGKDFKELLLAIEYTFKDISLLAENTLAQMMFSMGNVEYIYDMPIRLAAADVVICRAGAMTVSELAMAGKCAVFIPSPNVTDDQQFKNASVLSVEHAAYVLRENDSMPQRLCEIVSELIDNADKRAEMENKIKRFAKADANKVIYNDILKLIEK